MSRYRWLRPSKCIETMEFFPALKEETYEELQKRLFDAVSRGDVRAMLNNETVPKAHIAIYLRLYALASPDQDPNTVPPDLTLSLDDLNEVFDRRSIDNRKRGRPAKEHSSWSEDRRLADEMHRMLAGHPTFRRAGSAAEAARILVKAGRVSGAGTPESRAKRLERAFRKYYSS
jgi:hypothetical protein